MSLDLVVKNGTVVDGSGGPRYQADIGIKDGNIVEIGRIRAAAEQTIDADGLIVAPGFIDGHTHRANGRAGRLGPARQLLMLARRYQRCHGELRVRARAVQTRRPRMVRPVSDGG